MALRRAYLRMHRSVDAQFGQAGVTADQFVVLSALVETRALTQRQLADQVDCDQNTLRAMLLLLEKKGLIQRSAHPTDGRARHVSLTAEGKQLQQVLGEQINGLRESLGTILGSDGTEVLLESLRRIAAALAPKEASE